MEQENDCISRAAVLEILQRFSSFGDDMDDVLKIGIRQRIKPVPKGKDLEMFLGIVKGTANGAIEAFREFALDEVSKL